MSETTDEIKKAAAAEGWRIVVRKPSFSLLTVAVFVAGFILRGCAQF
jgi:hypothetical protein